MSGNRSRALVLYLATLPCSLGAALLRGPLHTRTLGGTTRACIHAGLFPKDEGNLIESAHGEQAGGLFPDDDQQGTRVERERFGIDEYTDHTRTKQRMKDRPYEQSKEAVPVNRAAKRAMAKKKAKAAKKAKRGA